MDKQRWEKMWELFHQSLEVAAADRHAFLAEVCTDDPDLGAEVAALLASHEQAPSLLDPLRTEGETDPLIGRKVGPYRIERLVGRGGMGLVFAAQQEEPIHRQVALKLIKVGMDTREVVARFESERQALALMDHPHIASVHDAGASDEGRPYFVMELVDGRPITEHCDARRLTVRQRLELFIPVCRAVQHAHQKGVIHRDLKPTNILVATRDGQPFAKVIDFGIAKAVHQPLTDRSIATGHGRAIGTPGYMSPEQRAMATDVDTRSDIYSLGVVLYELLVGALPLDPAQVPAADPVELDRAFHDSDFPTPSARLRASGADTAYLASSRGTDARALRRELKGDLDWIVMRALAGDREIRYASADELATDLARYLEHRPVSAGPPGSAYRIRKLIRRHRVSVGVAAALALTLILGSLGTTWLAMVARRQRQAAEAARDDARKEAETARAINAVLEGILSAPDNLYSASSFPRTARDVRVVDVLDRASGSLADLDAQPEVAAALLTTLGLTYNSLGLFDIAEQHLQRSLAMRRELLGDEHPDTLVTSHYLAMALHDMGNLPAAESLLRSTCELRQRTLGSEHPDTLRSRRVLAVFDHHGGRLNESEQLLRELIPVARQVFGEEHEETLLCMSSLLRVLTDLGRHDEAEPLAVKVLEIRRRTLGEEHPDTISSQKYLATVVAERGALAEAEKRFREVVALEERISGVDHPRTLNARESLAVVLDNLGRHKEAELIHRDVLARSRAVLDPAHPLVLEIAHGLARSLTEGGKPEEAVIIYHDILGPAQATYGTDHYMVGTITGGLGVAFLRQRRYAEAERHLTASYRCLAAALGGDHPSARTAQQWLNELYAEWGKPDTATLYGDSLSE